MIIKNLFKKNQKAKNQNGIAQNNCSNQDVLTEQHKFFCFLSRTFQRILSFISLRHTTLSITLNILRVLIKTMRQNFQRNKIVKEIDRY